MLGSLHLAFKNWQMHGMKHYLACLGDLWEVGMNHPAGLASLVDADLYAARPCYSHLLLLSSTTAFLQSKHGFQ